MIISSIIYHYIYDSILTFLNKNLFEKLNILPYYNKDDGHKEFQIILDPMKIYLLYDLFNMIMLKDLISMELNNLLYHNRFYLIIPII